MQCIFALVMNEALICIGSNENKENNLDLCQKLLSDIFTNIIYSDTCISIPYGNHYKNDFINQLAVIYTSLNMKETADILKSVEKKIGREPGDKKLGLVKIDIDLVIWNNDILKPIDMQRSYLQDLLPGFFDKVG